MTNNELIVEGEPTPPYKLFKTNLDGSSGELVEQFWTKEQAQAYRPKLDFKPYWTPVSPI